MSKFIDHHPMPQLPPEVMAQTKANAEGGVADENGVTPLNIHVGHDGTAFCHTEARDAESVLTSHAAMGVTLDPSQITEVDSLV